MTENEMVNSLKKSILFNNKKSFIFNMFLYCLNYVGENLIFVFFLDKTVQVASTHEENQFLIVIILWAMINIINTFIWIVHPRVNARFLSKAMKQYKEEAFRMLLNKKIGSLTRENKSLYISALTNDITEIEQEYLQKIFQFAAYPILAIITFFILFTKSPKLTIYALILSAISLLLTMKSNKKLVKEEENVSNKYALFTKELTDITNGFDVLKSFKAEKYVQKQFYEVNANLEQTKQDRNTISRKIDYFAVLVDNFVQESVLLIGTFLALKNNSITASTLIVFTQCMNYFMIPIRLVPPLIAAKKSSDALMHKLAKALLIETTDDKNLKEIHTFQDSIQFQDVSFSYESNRTILDHITLEFEKNKSYAIVGDSGSGKSTLVKLLTKENRGYKGELHIDNLELNEISEESLMNHISFIQQNVFIFNDTLENNITMYKDVEKDILEEVIKKSGLEELVEQKGLDFNCGDNGSCLSGGEKQRVAVARCLLRGSEILIMDEATSALDNQMAYQIENTIFHLKNVTRIVVTHRMVENSLNKFDEIIVLKNGRVEEKGSFNNLMQNKGYFYALYTVFEARNEE